ncbi:hypothetical protein [Actinomadura algeriensis]|uniref:Zn finger protein HypA/HybF involved in hydrogenase expression n=1 Tax=Actinomadura algeriensis TaxID=1679523 RepID=A0ABR9JTZ8_9ACTN|nr:hypothetical protein [Actinomadura algeriensis]MBE1534035.1 Zn finger protein HypA/HybF involved in hydrogenase expression [Actinomadura algeriensis]
MRDAWSSREVWTFACLRCSTTWDEQIEIRHFGDGHGTELVTYERGGQPCTTPWADRACPECQSQNVKAISSRHRRVAEIPKARPNTDVALVYHLRRIHAW